MDPKTLRNPISFHRIRGRRSADPRGLARAAPLRFVPLVWIWTLLFSFGVFGESSKIRQELVSERLLSGTLRSAAQSRPAAPRNRARVVDYTDGVAPAAAVEIFSDGFEGVFPGEWLVVDLNGSTGGDVYWGRTSYRADVGSWSAGCAAGGANASAPGTPYKNNMDSWMVYGPFDLSDATSGSLSFRLWNNSESGQDYFKWYVTLDLHYFSGYGTSGNTGGWVSRSLDFTDVPTFGDITGEPEVWIAFVFSSNESNAVAEGAYVDEVRIEKTTGGGEPILRVEPAQLIFEKGAGSSSGAFQTSLSSEVPVPGQPVLSEELLARLEGLARQEGSVPVIVGVREPFVPEGLLRASEVAQQRAALAAAQQRLLARLAAGIDFVPQTVKLFETVPYLALRVTEAGLRALTDDPDVSTIEEDVGLFATLADSVPLIGASALHGSGIDGEGMVIAVLDTGVDKFHPFLLGKVISEACYSSVYGPNEFSFCPGGSSSSTADGSGVNCDASILGCDHGTHVAGIAAGDGSSPGVAKGSQLIAVQVFHGEEDDFASTPCADRGLPSPCKNAWLSDLMSGLERVYALRVSFAIAAVNLSLGGGYFTSPCDSRPEKPIIDNLRSADIAVVASSGNEAYLDGMGEPACISSAISVGGSTKTDGIYSFSNSANFLDLLAPGQSIRSSVPGGGFETWNGTSMAAPHVSGAFTLLKSVCPEATVDELLAAFKATGVPILDPRNGIVKPRIQVDTALALLPCDGQTEPFYIHNDGTATLSVESLALNSPAAWIDWQPQSPFEVEPGGSQIVMVSVDFGLAPAGESTRQLNVNSNGGTGSVEIVVINSEGLPAPPSNLEATAASSSQINLSWTDNSSNETGFKIERSLNGSTGWGQIATVSANVTAYQNTGLSPGTHYYYRVRAYNSTGDSGYSNTADAWTEPEPVPAAPSNLVASTVSSSQINLSWTDNSSNETGFKIERSPNGSTGWSQIATVGANVTSYPNTGLSPSTHYYYRVRAYNGAGDSGYSNTADAWTGSDGVPAAPTNLTASAVSPSQINLSWTDNSSNETGFKIERGSAEAGPFTEIATVGANITTYQDTGLTASTTYYYRVRATNSGGDSGYSNTANATTLASGYDVPGDFTIGGSLGVGIETPARAVHLKGSNAVFRMDRSTNSAAFLLVRTDGSGNPLKTYVVGVDAWGPNQGEFIINDLGTEVGGAGPRRLTITNEGNAIFTGSVTAAQYLTSSSLRFKTNVETLEDPVAKVMQLRGVRFDWKATGQRAVGLIAEEVAPVLPEVVSTDSSGQAQGVNYDGLVALLVEASKEQELEIQALKERQAQLQKLLKQLKQTDYAPAPVEGGRR